MSWDRTKPAYDTEGVSDEIRGNFQALDQALGGVNLLADPYPINWPVAAVSSHQDPAHWETSGTGAKTIRETSTVKMGRIGMGAKLTGGASAAGKLTQHLLTTTSYDSIFDGMYFSAGAWVYASDADSCYIRIGDGYSSTESTAHAGTSTWQWMTVTHLVDASATNLYFELQSAANKVAILNGATVLAGQIPPQYFHAPITVPGTIYCQLVGTQTAGTQKFTYVPQRPIIIRDVQIYAKTGATWSSTALVYDINTWNGSAFASMFSSPIAFATTGDQFVADQPDGTYERRCLRGGFVASGTSIAEGKMISVDCDSIGDTTAGSDVAIHMRGLQFSRPLEAFLGYNEES